MAMLSFASVANTDALIHTANNAYNEGLYDSALNVYNKVLEQGYESSELYYNIGNAYFKNNDLPSAILFYEKASKLLPNDEDIEYNLSIANSMIVDKIEKVPELFYEKWWEFFYNIMGANAWAIVSLVFIALVIIVVGLFIISKTRQHRKISFFIGVVFIVFAVASYALAYEKYDDNVNNNEAIVFTPSITVKSSPTPNAVDLFVIHDGTKVEIIDKIDNWVEIKIQNGSIGWIPMDAIKEI